MKELKKIAAVLTERLNTISEQGFTEERLALALTALEALNHKLDSDAIEPFELNAHEIADDGSADGD